MPEETGRPPVVMAGEVHLIIATSIAAIDYVADYVQLTLCFDQRWGTNKVQEREVTGRVVFMPDAWAALRNALSGAHLPGVIKMAEEAERAH